MKETEVGKSWSNFSLRRVLLYFQDSLILTSTKIYIVNLRWKDERYCESLMEIYAGSLRMRCRHSFRITEQTSGNRQTSYPYVFKHSNYLRTVIIANSAQRDDTSWIHYSVYFQFHRTAILYHCLPLIRVAGVSNTIQARPSSITQVKL